MIQMNLQNRKRLRKQAYGCHGWGLERKGIVKFFFFHVTIFKNFIEFVTIFLMFWLRGMWVPSSLIRDGTCTPCIGRRNLNHWTAREVLSLTA